ncbi:TPA: helix-turn-helix domain-containing protein [Enterococcus faecalis]|nr:helix-turn-helix domain-containing protein [Enterococcus faecalis]
MIGTQISLLRKKFGLTQEDLANKLGFSKQTVSNWETGLKTPRMGAIQKIADLFNVSKSFIIEGIDESKNSSIEKIYNQLESRRQQKVYDFAENQLKEQKQEIKRENNPITSLEQFRKKKEEGIIYGTTKWYGAVSAGTGEFLTDETCEEIELPIEQIPDEADFCLSVNGDSMEPIFHDNDYVFVKRQSEIFSGNIGVVIVNGESFLKRIWFENNNIRLESFNKKYKDIIITENDEFRIVGKVVM